MKNKILLLLVSVCGCAGPVALDRAIWLRHDREYRSAVEMAPQSPKAAWYAWKARQIGQPLELIQRADAALSTKRNPFNANRDPESVSRGAVIFRENCARCHGADARGGGKDMLPTHPTADFHAFAKRFAVTLHGGAPRTWYAKIRDGYGETVAYPSGASPAMPAFGEVLASEHIWLAVTYLQSLDKYARPELDAARAVAR